MLYKMAVSLSLCLCAILGNFTHYFRHFFCIHRFFHVLEIIVFLFDYHSVITFYCKCISKYYKLHNFIINLWRQFHRWKVSYFLAILFIIGKVYLLLNGCLSLFFYHSSWPSKHIEAASLTSPLHPGVSNARQCALPRVTLHSLRWSLTTLGQQVWGAPLGRLHLACLGSEFSMVWVGWKPSKDGFQQDKIRMRAKAFLV